MFIHSFLMVISMRLRSEHLLASHRCWGVMFWVCVKRLQTTSTVIEAIQIKLNFDLAIPKPCCCFFQPVDFLVSCWHHCAAS